MYQACPQAYINSLRLPRLVQVEMADVDDLCCDSMRQACPQAKINSLRLPWLVQVEMADFDRALAEVKPAFGVTTETLEQHRLNGIIDSGQQFRDLSTTLRNLVAQVCCDVKQLSAYTVKLVVTLSGQQMCVAENALNRCRVWLTRTRVRKTFTLSALSLSYQNEGQKYMSVECIAATLTDLWSEKCNYGKGCC